MLNLLKITAARKYLARKAYAKLTISLVISHLVCYTNLHLHNITLHYIVGSNEYLSHLL